LKLKRVNLVKPISGKHALTTQCYIKRPKHKNTHSLW